MKTLEDAWISHNDAAPGADVLRLCLASAVILHHAFPLTYGPAASHPLGDLIVPMFFCLSGMLVTGSALRTSWRQFAVNRALRIYPALIVVTLLTALVLGPALTSLPLDRYFADRTFWLYLVTMSGWTRFDGLPGVFDTLPYPGTVNGSLWSIRFELMCYGALAVLMAAKLVKDRRVMACLLVLTLALGLVPAITSGHDGIRHYVAEFVRLFAFFAAGSVLYLFRKHVPLSWPLFLLAAAVPVLMEMRLHAVLLPITAAYCTVFLAMLPLRPLFGRNDYSYGIYLYAFPIQRTFVHLFPDHRIWWLNILFSPPIAVLFGAASWTLVERPMLLRKKAVLGWLARRISQRAEPPFEENQASAQRTAMPTAPL